LKRIEECAFRWSGLKSIEIPFSLVVLGRRSFCECKSLESVTFESGSRLERIKEFAFSESGLKSIVIPSSVVVLGEKSFYWCRSLESVKFESGSRMKRINESMFDGSRVSFCSVSQEFKRSLQGRFPKSSRRCHILGEEVGEEAGSLELAGGFDDLFG
jgi:hypothetical protein